MSEKLTDIHNLVAPLAVKTICKATLDNGGDGADVMVTLESVIAGTFLILSPNNDHSDDDVIDTLCAGLKERMKDVRAKKKSRTQ